MESLTSPYNEKNTTNILLANSFILEDILGNSLQT